MNNSNVFLRFSFSVLQFTFKFSDEKKRSKYCSSEVILRLKPFLLPSLNYITITFLKKKKYIHIKKKLLCTAYEICYIYKHKFKKIKCLTFYSCSLCVCKMWSSLLGKILPGKRKVTECTTFCNVPIKSKNKK